MPTKASVARFLALSLALSMVSCSSNCGSSDSAPPREVESGFEFQRDAFVFENYGGDAVGVRLTPSLVARMFGPETVCIGGQLPCELNIVAQQWMETANGTLFEGRSEGFAVLSLLFHAGELDPAEFGGETVADLRLFGNPALQEEFAYWAATQMVPSAVVNDKRYAAKDVIPFLAKALDPETEKHYRLAIAQRTETGFARGHAVTPIGYYKGEGDVYWLRIYDNNFPDQERRIEIDPKANTWRYEIPPLDDGETIVYEGTPENGNQLYFSAVEDRLGVLQAPFAEDSPAVTLNYSNITLVATSEGEETGIRDGEVLEAEGDRVVPGFSACPRCGADLPIIHQTLVNAGITRAKKMEIKTNGSVSATGNSNKRYPRPGDGVDWVSATGPKYNTTVHPSGDTSKDTVTFSEGGSTEYTSGSGNGVQIKTSHITEDNTQLQFWVTVEGSDDPENQVTVRIVTDENGTTSVEVEGLPAGKQVEIQVGRVSADGSDRYAETVTFQSNGGTASASLSPTDEKVTVQNADSVSGGNCANDALDEEYETDVDCGGECNGCVDGKFCDVDADCQDGTCVVESGVKICRAAACYDGVQNGEETDVDCGGSLCGACIATVDNRTTPQCSEASDCDTGHCLDGRCRIKQQVILRANRLPQGGTTLRYELDGQGAEIRLGAAQLEGPHEWVLGEAYAYRPTVVLDCVMDDTDARYTGVTADGDNALTGQINLDCAEENEFVFFARIQYFRDVPPVPEDDPMTLEYTVDGVTSTTELSGDARDVSISTYQTTWSARMIKNPLRPVTNLQTGEMGSYACEVLPWRNDNGAPRFNVREAGVYCEWAPTATCSDGKQNQDESSIDCGGVCSACPRNSACYTNSDCQSPSVCLNGTCDFDGTCSDATQNQDETDVDCGGTVCGGCAANQSCSVSSDCASANCQANVCIAPSCSDSLKNQNEGDVDCGGVCATKCAIGSTCNVNGDCDASGCVAGTCAESCSDGFQNQDETATDCGGSTCSGCTDGLACSADSDCASNYCLNNVCATASCSDATQNQDESDVDCGGLTCGACSDGQACRAASDCTSNYCVGSVCTTATCSDGTQNQDETDVDCGGSTCGGCAIGAACTANSDCAGNNCSNNVCAASCSDGIQNQDETGIDCGGSTCGGCGAGAVCTVDSDCSTNNCECTASSGNCTGGTGTCGAAKLVVDLPTTDGIATSGSFTVPAQCSQVYIQAWGAAGGAGGSGGGMMIPGTPGGAGGYVSGTLSVLQGDVIDVWVGQGGDFGVVYDFGGSPSIGSQYGVRTDGGIGDGDSFTGGGGGGGGLTSVRLNRGATTIESFVVPAGGGGTDFGAGDDVSALGGGGALGPAGEDAPIASQEAGGGAGAQGGSYLGSAGGAAAGTYGTYPAGFTTADGTSGTPANTTAPDYSSCQGIGAGSVGAGANPLGSMWNAGGDGCVVIRCVGQ